MNKDIPKMAIALTGITLLLVFILAQYAEANEMNLMIEGENDDHGIFIAIDGRSNILMWDTVDGYSEHFDGNLKVYKSGNFSLKNPVSGIAIWAHAIEDTTQYKLVILTSEGVYRLNATTVIFEGDTPATKKENPIDSSDLWSRTIINEEDESVSGNTTIYPKSSVGADITKYDIPTIGRDSDNIDPMILTLKPDMIPVEIRLGDEFEWSASVINARQGNSAKIENATVTLEISRDDYIIRSYSEITNNAGQVTIKISDISYPEFYPKFCYDVIVTTSYEDSENTWDDEFLIQYTLGTTSWNPNTDWMGESRWNYLPSSFQQEPRPTVNGDDHCND